jgi:membrane protease subunit (stomatin/prohibitin family)
LHIEDPILFVARYVPATFLQGQGIFDFTDRNNPAASQLLAEVVGSLSAAFSRYTNDSDKGHRITTIQRDALGFAHALSETVQEAYGWREKRGLAMSQATIMGIGYDPATQELLQTVQRADALAGSRGNVNLQASLAEGIQQAGSQGGSEGILGIGLAAGSVGLAGMMQQEPSTSRGAGGGPAEDDLIATLTQLKQALDAGLITEQEFDDAKAKALGLA